MTMLYGKSSLILQVPRVCYECIRTVRGGSTIRGKLVKPLIPLRKQTINDANRRKIIRANIGIGNALATYMDHEKARFDNVNEDYLMDMEQSLEDFHDVIQTSGRIERQKFERNSFLAAKRKYMKDEKLPNMLTYIEKQQIKHLHKKNPDVWTPETLAESFPATPEIIKKILKSHFTAFSVEQALKHDVSVKKNWKLFKTGELQLSEDLRQIYSKFVDRQIVDPDINEIKKFIPPPPDFASQIPVQEFGSIISSTKQFQKEQQKLKAQREEEEGRPIYETSPNRLKIIDEDTYLHPQKQHYTLESLRSRIGQNIKCNSNTAELDRLILSEKPSEKLLASVENDSEEKQFVPLSDCTSYTGVISHDYDPVLPIVLDRLPLRIRIPRYKREKGKLYRVLDRFYDSDGNFMFRVPGLIG